MWRALKLVSQGAEMVYCLCIASLVYLVVFSVVHLRSRHEAARNWRKYNEVERLNRIHFGYE